MKRAVGTTLAQIQLVRTKMLQAVACRASIRCEAGSLRMFPNALLDVCDTISHHWLHGNHEFISTQRGKRDNIAACSAKTEIRS